MTYVRLDDHFPQHRKILGLDDSAFALYVRSICYCATQLSNGNVIMAALPLLTRHRKPLTLVAQLVEASLWEVTLEGWRVHDYLEWQESADSVLGKRAAARERMQRLRSQDVRTNNERSSPEVQKSSQKVREQAVETENREQKEQNPPVGPPLPEQGTASAKRRGSGIPTNWTPSEALTTWANAKHPTVDLEAATEGFLNHAADKGRTTKSTDAAWRNWIIKAEDWGPHKPSAQLALANGNHPHRDPNQANADAVARRMGLNPADTDPFGTAPDEPWRKL